MTTNHKYYLSLALNIARTNLGKTKLNPSVGTVIVKNSIVIATGTTSINGRPHAEFNALKKNHNSSIVISDRVRCSELSHRHLYSHSTCGKK